MSHGSSRKIGHADASPTRDDVIAWLLDHVGEDARVWIDVDRGTHSATLVSAEGRLRHWRDEPGSAVWQGRPREDVVGLFHVGEDGSLDASELPEPADYELYDEHVRVWDAATARELRVELADSVTLRVVIP